LALACASSLAFDAASVAAAPKTDPLAAGFQTPPQAARPRLWWHWMAGNISSEGARLDLDWMRRIGVGGVHAFSGGNLPESMVVPKPVAYMSEEWAAIFRQSLGQARGAGMEVGVAGSPGWSETGGPWVASADGMKKYVWSETVVEGGRPVALPLPPPPRKSGAFQGAKGTRSKLEAYGDAAVFAFPTPPADAPLPAPAWRTQSGPTDASPTVPAAPSEGSSVTLTPEPDGPEAWLEATFPRPVTTGAVSMGVKTGAVVKVEAERSPGVFETLSHWEIEGTSGVLSEAAPQQTLAFPPTTASRFRLTFAPPPEGPVSPLVAGMSKPKQVRYAVSRLQFLPGSRINGFEAKAGFQPSVPSAVAAVVAAPAGASIDPARVVDLTGRMSQDGALDWTPPPGLWTIVRLGWSLTGAMNSPAEPAATGLEVDKLDPAAVGRYLKHYLGLYEKAGQTPLGPRGVQTLLTDSWEAGVQNWTPAMLLEFRRRRGYDPMPYLPVLTGRVVADADTSERFLFDFRQTLKDLVADNHYGVIARTLRARGMAYYTEAQGDNPRAILDGMTAKARADIPTGEFWYRPFATLAGQPPLQADLKEAASAAHVYGKPLVAAEALTVAAPDDPWSFSPAKLKPVADEIFAHGVNRMLLHESHAQPLVDAKPGLRLFMFGQYFNRNETWAEYAAPFIDYLSRSSYMLQQGRYVADVAYFYGEEHNLTELFIDKFDTDVPKGYGYDYINPEALLTLLSVKDGRLVTPSGMSYHLLYLPPTVTRLSLPALRKIRDLVEGGAVVVGQRPTGGLGLRSPDDAVARLAADLWGDGSTKTHLLGKGRVYTDMEGALAGENMHPDVAFEGGAGKAGLLSLHRRSPDADIYFISNQNDQVQTVTATFRVDGRAPELWRAETGDAEKLSYAKADGGVRTPLRLEPYEAVFVVFRRPAQSTAWTAPATEQRVLASIEGPWRVTFEPGRGAPASARFDHLISWPKASDPGVRYFSGAATYAREITVDPAWLATNHRVQLDLGQVYELARVSVNGKLVGTAWRPPYQLDITKAVKPGRNELTIEVVNLWPNRLIGDKQPGASPVAVAPQSPYRADSPLLPSGLVGPVKLVGLTRTNP